MRGRSAAELMNIPAGERLPAEIIFKIDSALNV